MIIITGTGRNGTSFVAECYRAIGIQTGGTFYTETNSGWEDDLFVSINSGMIQDGLLFAGCDEAQKAADGTWGDRMRGLAASKQVVKNPDAAGVLEAWIHAGVVDRVIMPIRPIDDVLESQSKWKMKIQSQAFEEPTRQDLLAVVGRVIISCSVHNIPLVTFKFPEVVEKEAQDFWTLVSELTYFGVSVEEAVKAIRETRQ